MIGTMVGAASAAIWVYLLTWRGGFWRIRPDKTGGAETWAPPRRVAVVVPARNEADVIGCAVASLMGQRYPGALDVVVVDDHSTDGTAEIAQRAASMAGAADRLRIVRAEPVPPGWTGKLWAVHHGIDSARALDPDYLLLTDADVVHAPDNLASLVARAESGGYDLVSLMVKLHCRTGLERLLIPAFVFFFFKLYPPRHVADPARRIAAAAGGCMLIRRNTLDRIGGVGSIRREIIDDCALARRAKATGKIWLGAADDTVSIREYGSWRAIWDMIARCAFAQLGYSAPALAGTVIGMALVYLAPPLLLLAGPAPARVLGAASWAGMSAAFVPVLRLYRVPVALAPLLPLAALFYTAATIGSAVQYWRGRGGRWKGRFQAAPVR